jgi:hypothetical protein
MALGALLMHPLLEDREVGVQLAGIEGWRDDHVRYCLPIIRSGEVGRRSPRLVMAVCSGRARTPECAPPSAYRGVVGHRLAPQLGYD